MSKVLNRTLFILFVLTCSLSEISAQALSFDLKKPKSYEDRKLPSEKSADKKFTVVRRFTQNAFTKFNWNFNSVTRLNELLDKAKAAHRDDYNRLLSFYNYNLDQTSQFKTDLDSIIYKTNAGILTHDLRNAWIDNLYLTMGKAYYFRNELDTAFLTFQYINYAFAPKEKDGYDIPIGSNATEGGNAFSVSTKEKRNISTRVLTTPPSRNESLVWQIKTYIAQEEFGLAAGLIETLKADPNFPDRLKLDLLEVQAHWFYEQKMYDSAAIYLEQALPNAQNNKETARWEYLIAQLYERSGDHESSSAFYERATKHTYDPVMELYARLNTIRQHKGDDKVAADNIEALIKMAKRDKYTNYRDIIYYTAAQMELERNNIAGAKILLLRATTVQVNNPENSRKQEAFLLLAQVTYKEKQYPDSKRFYDSVSVSSLDLNEAKEVDERKRLLARIVEQLDVVYRQDSLQRIAAMSETERTAFIRKLAKQLRKQQGLKEDDSTGTSRSDINNKNAGAEDLFGTSTKGDWYFQNTSLKSRGFTEFKGKWGNRANTDNWRRAAAASRFTPGDQQGVPTAENKPAPPPAEISFEALLKPVPLTAEAMKVSNDSLEVARFMLGKIYTESVEDFESAIVVLEDFIEKYPGSLQRAEALFLLHYCYMKTGNTAKAAATKQALEQKYPGSNFQKIATDPKNNPEKKAKEDATRRYENIYGLFIEGRFQQALDEKKIADSLYGKNYWTPQLLYIESIYYIKLKDDEKAKAVLQQIISLFPNSILTPKAKNLLDVLSRRREIEDYLTKLQIERPKDDSLTQVDDATKPAVNAADSAAKAAELARLEAEKAKRDSIAKAEEQARLLAAQALKDSLKKAGDQRALDSIQKAEQLAQKLATEKALKDSLTKVAEQKFKDSVLRVEQLAARKKATADSLQNVLAKATRDSLARIAEKTKKDSVKPKQPTLSAMYTADNEAPHFVMLILEKVDPVYVSEARNAFNRYNRSAYTNNQMDVVNQTLNDTTTLVLMSPFPNAAAALDYMEKTKKVATAEIVPWMPIDKLKFSVISAANLEKLKETVDLKEYRRFQKLAYPGKFDQ